MWPDLIRKAKEGGLNAIETYVFWNTHEPQRRFPVWLHNMPGIEFRTDNKVFPDEMANFTTLIVNMVKDNHLFASQGGPIILAQLRGCYIQWCANLAQSLNIRVPWVMCQQDDAPAPMYYGGTNYGRSAGGLYITTSYDYDLHEVLKSVEEALTYGVTENYQYPNFVDVQLHSYNGQDVCFMGNAHESYDATISFRNREYFIPAWFVTILPDCVKPVYNTAHVNVQTSIMVKEHNPGSFGQEEPLVLDCHWKNEHIEKFERSGPPRGRTQYAQNGQYSFTYEIRINLRKGKNYLTLCSSTVGLAHSGAYFGNVPVGIKGVQIVNGSDGTVTRDLSTNQWVYKVGLLGETTKLFDVSGLSDGHRWRTELLSTSEQFIWYKTNFKTSLLPDLVVVDLKGLGKGHAWVNGYSIGRFWSSYKTECDDTSSCDYRGAYGADKGATNCAESTQRCFGSFKIRPSPKENTLVLVEEIGGNPYSITIQIVTVGKICTDASKVSVLELSCQGGRIINEIKFVSFGLYKDRCSINVNETTLGITNCYQATFDSQVQFTGNQLAVEMECAHPNF
ncbi:unnamed protein product [Malus baccata var. baccata]